MARKSKRVSLNEAIRQGQAKINEGLKTGQIKPDSQAAQRSNRHKIDLFRSKNRIKMPVNGIKAFFLKSEETFFGRFSPKSKLITLFCLAWVVILALGIWLTSLVESNPSKPIEATTAVADVEKSGLTSSQKSSSDIIAGVAGVSAEKGTLSTGDNVIWIQSIPLSRKGELKPLGDFFRRKGIETEIIEFSGSNLAVLVTQQGFERNPSIEGTEGHMLFERVKQLGAVYVEETKDTEFGKKPFQDVLGYKRQ
jgi:hypothetical protein